MKVYLSIFLSLLTIDSIYANEKIVDFDYSKADSIAISFKEDHSNDVKFLSQKLTAVLETEHEKYRAIFRWIAENIEYKRGHYGKDSEKILKKGTAVCEGYSSLLYEMCEAVGIECEIIIGYSKTIPGSDIPLKLKKTDHAWNAVKLDNSWYLSDVTWATSYYDTGTRKFVKEFDDRYFLSDPNFFLLNHYPEDKNWILTDTSYTKGDFKKGPVYYSYYLDFEFKNLKIPRGLVGKRIKVTFNTPVEIQRVSIVFENSRKSETVALLKTKGNLVLEHEFGKRDIGAFTVFLNGKAVWGFKKK